MKVLHTLGLVSLETASDLAIDIAVAAVGAAIATAVVHRVFTVVIGRTARRRLAGVRTIWRWRTRRTRPLEGTAAVVERRRRQRIDAAALALSRLAAVVIWAGAVLVVLEHHQVSVTAAVGSAGFIGLVLALGAQTSVNDWVNGLHVLLEDRFGEGDEIELMTANGREIRGVVTELGMFGTRIVSTDGVHHVANRQLGELTNHTQLGVSDGSLAPSACAPHG